MRSYAPLPLRSCMASKGSILLNITNNITTVTKLLIIRTEFRKLNNGNLIKETRNGYAANQQI
jgi:hypothetical protein